MASIRIKICGVTTPEDARFAAEAGADAVGLNFYPSSPRYLTPRRAAEIVRALPPFTAPVGVFVGMPMRQVCAVSYQLGLRSIQTYDNNPPTEDPFPFAHIPAFRVKDSSELNHIRQFVEAATALGRRPAAILIDSRVEGQIGGSGHVAPWSLLAGFDTGVPLILAGGLTPENVADAIAIVRPWGVDVASGVELSPGLKDPAKVAAFIRAARKVGGD
ncbi:MAG TPA: phosphoribosylanthranilate isomerase [Gemmata sp.]|jgi:phosphoribosylanthranilate isomerase|nr:phosphoribosylanthranilate isomerase [Gemmata sp.]